MKFELVTMLALVEQSAERIDVERMSNRQCLDLHAVKTVATWLYISQVNASRREREKEKQPK